MKLLPEHATDEMEPRLIIVPEIDSTNLALRREYQELPDGTLYCALNQTAGRGRLNRRWITPPNSALCCSMLFKSVSEPYHAGAVIALAALELINGCLGNEEAFFKWPNDIYIRSAKLAGILSEGVIEQGRFAAIISGVGININQDADMLAQLDNSATSIYCQCGRLYDLETLYTGLFAAASRIYKQYLSAPEEIISLWKKANRLQGRLIEAVRPDGTVLRGIFRDIAPDGAMIMEYDGKLHRFDCGDIKITPSFDEV